MLNSKRKLSLILISCLLSSQALLAEELVDMSLEELLQVELFSAASLTPIEQHKAPGTVYSFTSDNIEHMGVRRLDELLEFVPGMQTSQYRKRHKAVTARGVVNRYNSRTMLMVDGRPLRHSYYGHYGAWDNFPIELIDKVEIIMGPSSAIYGANAFAATISITTRSFTKEQENTVSAEIGNHGRMKFTNHYRDEKTDLMINYIGQDAPYPADRLTLLGESPALQDLNENLFSIYGKVKLNEHVTISTDYQNLSYPFVYILNDRSVEIDERPLNISANYVNGDLESGRVEAVVYYNRDDVNETEVSRATGLQEIESQDANIYGARINRFKKFGSHHLAAGFEWRHDAADNMNTNGAPLLSNPNISQNNYSLFVEDAWEVNDKFNLTFGARFDDFELYGSELSPRLGVVYSPSTYQSIKFLYGEGVRTPTYREAFKILDSVGFEQPALNPERSNMFELIYNYRSKTFNFSASAYHNVFSNYITEQLTPDGLDEFSLNSTNDWHMHGMDIESAYQFGNHKLRGTMSFINIDEKNTDLEFPVANMTATLEYGYQLRNKHHLHVGLIYNGERNEYNDLITLEDQTDGFLQTNLSLNGPLTLNWNYSIGTSNLLDETIFDSQVDFNDSVYNNQRPEQEFWLRLSRTFK